MKFKYSYDKILRQDFGLPNFVNKDILDKEYTIKILNSFKTLGLSGIYLKLNENSIDSFKYFKIDNFLNLLEKYRTKYVQIIWTETGLIINDNISNFNKNEIWKFQNFKISPTLNRIYNK